MRKRSQFGKPRDGNGKNLLWFDLATSPHRAALGAGQRPASVVAVPGQPRGGMRLRPGGARSRDRIRKNGKISGFGARAEAEGLDCRARRSWLDRLVGQPRRLGLSNLWYGAQSPARLMCPAVSGLAGARDVGLDPGHAKGRGLAPGATLHMSQNGMWGDRHAQAGQRPSSTQSEAEPLTLRIAASLTWRCIKPEIVAVSCLTIAANLRQAGLP
jgi:hypothetical protein